MGSGAKIRQSVTIQSSPSQAYGSEPLYTSNGIHELWERVQVDWEEIAASECQKDIESMPSRVQAVLKAKGVHKILIRC